MPVCAIIADADAPLHRVSAARGRPAGVLEVTGSEASGHIILLVGYRPRHIMQKMTDKTQILVRVLYPG